MKTIRIKFVDITNQGYIIFITDILKKRYNVEIKCNDYKNGYILTIDNRNGKNNYFTLQVW